MTKKISLGLKTRLLQYLCFVGSVMGLFVADSQQLVVAIGLYFFFQTFAANIALHRYFAHRTFRTHILFDRILAVLGTLIGVGSVIAWVAQHSHHHDNSDTNNDIHSPHIQGVRQIVFGLWQLHVTQRKNIRHLLSDPFIVFLHENYFKFHFAYVAILFMISPLWVCYIYCIPNTLCLFSGYVLAIVDHWHGYQTYSTGDRSTNSWIANILTLGEGWHNNHHHAPGKLEQGERLWEWDLPAWIIKNFVASSEKSKIRSDRSFQ